MNREQLTIMVIPQKDGPVFQLDLTGFLIKAIALGLSLVFFGSLAILIDYFFVIEKTQEQSRLEKALKLQQFEIRSIENKLSQTRQHMVQFEEFDRKLRIISDLQDTRPPVQFASKEPEASDTQDPSTKMVFESRLLDYNIKVREASLFQLDSFLIARKDRLGRTPSIAPTEGHLSSGFGRRTDPFTGQQKTHNGMDFANGPFTPIYAPADGVVVNTFSNGGYGEFLVIDHGYNIVSRYAHLAKYEVSVGQKVKRGELIARMGNTGRSTATHLHYEVLVRDQPVDPEKYILR